MVWISCFWKLPYLYTLHFPSIKTVNTAAIAASLVRVTVVAFTVEP